MDEANRVSIHGLDVVVAVVVVEVVEVVVVVVVVVVVDRWDRPATTDGRRR